MLTFSFSGAEGILSVPETLTSGMVGKEVALNFSPEWEALIKVAVFTAGNVTKDVFVTSDRVVIPWEVLEKPLQILYVGVYGLRDDGTVVIPTVRAKGPLILPGASPEAAFGTEDSLGLWAQLTARLQTLEETVDQNQVDQSQALAQIRQRLDDHLLQNGDNLEEGLSRIQETLQQQMDQFSAETDEALGNMAQQLEQNIGTEVKTLLVTLLERAAYTAGVGGSMERLKGLWEVESTQPHVHSYTQTITKAPTCTATGLRTYTCSCGHSYVETIPMLGHTFVDGACVICGAADPDHVPLVTLTSIQVEYSGGPVTEGTSLDSLEGVTVTAYYSDGSSDVVGGYTLSGAIGLGSNTITVTFGSCQTTFVVEGVQAPSRRLLYNWDLTDTLSDTITYVTAMLGGTATQDETGMKLNSANASCYFGDNLFLPGRTIEIDVGDMEFSGATHHGFLVMNKTSQGMNSTGTEGLTYRYTNGPYSWQLYVCYQWQTMDQTISDAHAMANKTLKFVITSDREFYVYLGNVLLGVSRTTTAHGTELQIGSDSKAYSNVTILAVRIYEEG